MKLIHCADVHLGSVMETDLSQERAKERRRELLGTFMRLFDRAGKYGVSAVLISGDLFDSDMVDSGTASSVLDIFGNFPSIDVYYLRGNHDSECSPISGENLPPNLHLFSHGWTFYEAAPGIAIAGAELYTARDGGDAARKNMRLLSSLSFENAPFRSALHIVMLHGTLTDGSRSASPDSIPAGLLAGKGIDYLALGHIHAPREGKIDSRCSFAYPGCLEGRGFDECGPHGFILLDIDEKTGVLTRSFIPFASRTLHRIEADITGCTSSAAVCRRVRDILEKKKIPHGDMAQIVLTGETDILFYPDTDLIRQDLEQFFYLIRVTDNTRTAIDYDAYALDASLKGAFVREVQASGLSPADKIQVIRMGFRALEGENIV